MAAIDVDVETVETVSFDALPDNDYKVVIDSSELKNTKANDGKYYEFKLIVTEGDFKDRQLYSRLNIKNKNEKAQKIGLSQLKELCAAVNVSSPQDTEQLHDIPLLVRVRSRKDGDKTYNEIKNFIAIKKEAIAPAEKPKTAPWGAKK